MSAGRGCEEFVSLRAIKLFRKHVARVGHASAMETLARVVREANCPDDNRQHHIAANWCGRSYLVIARGTAVLTVVPHWRE